MRTPFGQIKKNEVDSLGEGFGIPVFNDRGVHVDWTPMRRISVFELFLVFITLFFSERGVVTVIDIASSRIADKAIIEKER